MLSPSAIGRNALGPVDNCTASRSTTWEPSTITRTELKGNSTGPEIDEVGYACFIDAFGAYSQDPDEGASVMRRKLLITGNR